MKVYTKNKMIGIRLPGDLYVALKEISHREYESISTLVRRFIVEHMEERLTEEEMKIIEGARLSFRQGKGVDWDTIRHE